MTLTMPLFYSDCEVRVLDDGTVIPIVEEAVFDTDVVPHNPNLVRLTLPPGRSWVLLPRSIFARDFLRAGRA